MADWGYDRYGNRRYGGYDRREDDSDYNRGYRFQDRREYGPSDYGMGWGPGASYRRGRYDDDRDADFPYERDPGAFYSPGRFERGRFSRSQYDYGRIFDRDDDEEDFDRQGYRGYRRGYDREDFDQRIPTRMGGYGRERSFDYDRGRFDRPDYGRDFEAYDDDEDFFAGDEELDFIPVSYTESWLIPGPFSGIGPAGYQRADARIHEDINDRLTQHGRLDASAVQVEVKNGEVTLRGTVDSRQAKRMAEDTAESVSGVKDVRNELRVHPGASAQPEAHHPPIQEGQTQPQSQSPQMQQPGSIPGRSPLG